MVRTPPVKNCKDKIYRFCKRRTRGRYKDNRANRRLGRAGEPMYRFVLTRIGPNQRVRIV